MSDRFSEQMLGLVRREGLPEDYAETVTRFLRPLGRCIAEMTGRPRPVIVGVSGAQGSGKSTLAAFLKMILEVDHRRRAVVLSLDDLYLTRAEREALAAEVHPLLVTRGVPGTHDVVMGMRTLDRLMTAEAGTRTLIPRFDKARDDRMPRQHWDRFAGRPDVILFEGWCVGALPQREGALTEPLNALERDEDPDGTWRRYVNRQLATAYPALFRRIDHLVMLAVPDFGCVRRWRTLQEQKLAQRVGQGTRVMAAADIERFVMHYERLTRHMLDEMPARADTLLTVDRDHRISQIILRRGSASRL
ncbi:MAG: hypothetical protein D6763_10255 [Alphaproteobacteria bacterium]|nr:MAG: hypothetical protein D6763_10255 [Alphaproteobacteria bacterium]